MLIVLHFVYMTLHSRCSTLLHSVQSPLRSTVFRGLLFVRAH